MPDRQATSAEEPDLATTGAPDAVGPGGPPRQRPWYRRTWKRVAVTWLVAAGIGIGAGELYLAGADDPAGAGSQGASFGPGGAVTEYSVADRTEPVQVSGDTLTGDFLSTEDLRGDVVVLNVWGSWCVPCRAEAPILAELSRSYAADGVSFVGINVRDNVAAALAFEQRYGIRYPSIFDRDGRNLLSLNDFVPASAVPVTVILDRQGRVAGSIIGQLRKATLVALLDTVIREPADPAT